MIPTSTQSMVASVAAERRDAAGTPEYLSVAAAASLLGLSQKTIQRAVKGTSRPLPHIRIGRRVLITRADLDRWIAVQRVVPTAAAGSSGDVAGLLQRLREPYDTRHRRR